MRRDRSRRELRSILPLLGGSLALLVAASARSAQLEVPGSDPYLPDQIVVKLAPTLGAVANQALGQGFSVLTGESESASLDELCAGYGVVRIRRVFSGLEDESGQLQRSARDAVDERLRRRGMPPGAALEARLDAVPDLENTFVFELDGASSILEAIAAFSHDPGVAWAEPVWIYRIAAEPLPPLPFVPNDRYVSQDAVTWSEGAFGQAFPDLYGLRNTHTLEGWNALDTDGNGIFEAGETRPGEGILVAVIDSGVDATHPDLADNIWVNPGEIPGNGIDDDGNGFVDDVSGWDFFGNDAFPLDPHGHGTHVAGTLAAVVDNAGLGVAGVGSHAMVVPVRGLGPTGSGSTIGLAAAVGYAIAIGADITSNSWGGRGISQVISDAFTAAEAAGLLSIAAAGNGNAEVSDHFPANLDTVMAVAAVDHDDRRAGFSNFGAAVEIAAPGVRVLSLNANGGANNIASGSPDNVVDGDYLQISGTSMSTPHVSGAAAVLMSAFPSESAGQIRGRLMGGAQPIDAVNPDFAGALGVGRADLLGSLDASPAPVFRVPNVTVLNFLPGEQAQISVRARNFWEPAANVSAVLSSPDPNVTIEMAQADLGDLDTGESASNAGEPFLVSLDPATPFGSIPFTVTLTADGGFSSSIGFAASIAFMSDVSDPAGLPTQGDLAKFLLFQDYTGDDLPDLLFADLLFDTSIFENRADRSFRRRNVRTGVPRRLNAWTSYFLDVDNDGDRDLLIGARGLDGARLLLNQGDGTTVDVSASSGIQDHDLLWGTAIDYNGDGWIDVLGGWGREDPARPLVLLENQGDLTFVDRLDEARLPPTPFPHGLGRVATLDHDDDGKPDVLFVAFGGGISLWRNQGDGSFIDASAEAFRLHAPGPSYGFTPAGVSGAGIGDCDNDGDLDLFVTARPFEMDPPSQILLNEGGVFPPAGDAAGEVVEFNVTGLWWGVEFLDFDNDGDLDLFVSKDVTYGGSELPGVATNALFENDGTCRYRLVNDGAFPSGVTAFGFSAMADYDGDGDLDIYMPGAGLFGNHGGLLRNEIGQRLHSLQIALVGTESSPDAYGARVTVEVGALRQIREVHSSAVDPTILHFGLGQAPLAQRVEVQWPSGIHQSFEDVTADELFRIVEVDCGRERDFDGDGVCDGIPVSVDIMPFVEPNWIVPSAAWPVPVVVFGSADFDVTEIDRKSLAFGPAGASGLGNGGIRKDVDGDGYRDLLSLYRMPHTGIALGDQEACVHGFTQDGTPLVGCDAIVTLVGCGIGFELAFALPPLLWLRSRRSAASRRRA